MIKKVVIATLLSSLLTLGLTSCMDDETTKPAPTPDQTEATAYDLWIPLHNATGHSYSSDFDEYVVCRAHDLTQGTLKIKGQGANTAGTGITPNLIYRDGYYYSISRKANNLGKFAIDGTTVKTIKEIPITQVQDRRFAHAWLDKDHLILMGSTGKKQAINWVRIDTRNMRVEGSGTLDLEAPRDKEEFNSAGHLGYRKSDNTLMYVYSYVPLRVKRVTGKPLTNRRPCYYVAFIDAKTMEVKKVENDNRAVLVGSISFGDTRSSHTMMDEEGNFYYIVCNLLDEPGSSKYSTTRQASKVFRIKGGELTIDKSYSGYSRPRGKIIDMTPISKDEVVLYVQDPKQATPDNPIWDSKKNRYVFFWEIMNIRSGEVRRLKGLPLSVGNYSHFAVCSGDKLFLGSNVEEDNSSIYIYDLKTGKATKGAEIEPGFEIERIQPVAKK